MKSKRVVPPIAITNRVNRRKQRRRSVVSEVIAPAEQLAGRADQLPSGNTARELRQAAVLQMQSQQGNGRVRQMMIGRVQGSPVQKQPEPDDGSALFGAADSKLVDALRISVLELQRDIAALKGKLDAAEAETKPDLLREIFESEGRLARALEQYVAGLEGQNISLKKQSASTDELAAVEIEIALRKSQLEMARRVFSAETAAVFAEKYKKEVKPLPGGGCMTAVYKGLEVLFSAEESTGLRKQVYKDAKKIMDKTGEDTNSMTRIMETLEGQGKAGANVNIEYKARQKKWEPDPEQTVLSMVSTSLPGWYFFGLSLHGAYHSVMLAVDTTGGAPQIYWMDQFSRGFTKNVTGKLTNEMKDWKPSYGFATTRVWPILPTADTVIEIE